MCGGEAARIPFTRKTRCRYPPVARITLRNFFLHIIFFTRSAHRNNNNIQYVIIGSYNKTLYRVDSRLSRYID